MAWAKTSRHSRGYDRHWDKLRKRILERDKHLCQECKRNGRIAAGNHVDHIVAKAKGGMDDASNLQTLCLTCHEAKTARDKGHRVKPVIGPDGWPLENGS